MDSNGIAASPVALAAARSAVATRLAERRSEIEAALLDRVRAISDPSKVAEDPAYSDGLRAAVSVAVGYGLETVERGEQRTPPPPPVLLAQARLAARSRVPLDTVLRRCLAGYTVLGEFLSEEVTQVTAAGVAKLLPGRAAVLDRLLAAVGEEYEREASLRPRSTEERRAERIQRLLDGELVDTADIVYDFSASHVGAVVAGPRAGRSVRKLAAVVDYHLLPVERDDGSVWVWFGGSPDWDLEALRSRLASRLAQGCTVSLGEPAEGIAGWRLTHRQAKAALPLAFRTGAPVIRYSEVALLAAALQDEVLRVSLVELYLKPLQQERDDGEAVRETLRAYFAAGRNVSSAAARLGVSRPTVRARLNSVEDLLDKTLDECGAELELALRLHGLSEAAADLSIWHCE